jgi:hypothetical protein
MLVKSLDQMEKIVQSNKRLSWDGWTVVDRERNEKAKTSKNGKLINNAWHFEKRYELSSNGWDIPDRLVNG